jgi:DNA processing protein
VVSGLARGIDGAAHPVRWPRWQGGTIGVIASGIDIAYPPEHADLQETGRHAGPADRRTAAGNRAAGAPFPLAQPDHRGLAAGTLVVEAAPRSGSLITARLAAEAGREVMAIPGSPLDSRARTAATS